MAETSNENKDLRKFYDYLQNGYKMKDLPDYTTFSGYMLNSENRKRIYDKMQKKGVKNMPSFEEFSSQIGLPTPEIPANVTNENARMRKFYDLLGNKYGMKGLPDYEQFSGDMQDSAKRQKVYDAMKKKGIRVPDSIDKFSELLGVSSAPQNQPTAVAKQPQTYPTAQVTPPQQGNISVPTPAPQKNYTVASTPVEQNDVVLNDSVAGNVNAEEQVAATPNTEQNKPYGQGLIFNSPEETQQGYTPYTERMGQQTAPINEMMEKTANTKELAEAEAEAWSQRKADYSKNADLFDKSYGQYQKDQEEYAQKVEEFNQKYSEGWQPKTRAEQIQYENDYNVIKAQENLLNAKAQVLGKEADRLNNEAMALNDHDSQLANMSSIKAQTLEGNINDLMGDVQNEIETARKQNQEARGNLRVPRGGIASLGGSMRSSVDPTVKHDKENEQTKFGIAERILQRTQNRIEQSKSERADEANGTWGVVQYMKNYWNGAVDTIKDGAGFDFGIKDAAEMGFLYSAIKKSDAIDKVVEKKAKGETLTKEEVELLKNGLSKADKAILDAAAMEVASEAMFKTGMGYTGGQVGVQMIPFALQIAINPLATVGESAGSGVIRYALKKYGAKGVKGAVARGLTKINPTLLSKTTQIGTDLTLGGVGQALTTGLGNTFADISQRRMGQMQYGLDDFGNVVFGGHTDGMSLGKAIASGVVSQSLEYSSENLSEWTGGLTKAIGLALKGNKVTGKLVSPIMNGFAKMSATEYGKLLNQYRKYGHIGDIITEDLEEVLNNTGNAVIDYITTGENHFNAEEGGVFNLEDNLETFLSVTMPQVFQNILGLAAVGGENAWKQHKFNQQYNQSIADNIKLFGADRWEAIRSVIDNSAIATDLARNVTALVSGADFTAEQKVGILEYAHNLQAKRAEDLADTKLTEYKYESDKDFEELAKRVNISDNTIQSATTADGNVVYLKSADTESGTVMVYNPATGETMMMQSSNIAEFGDSLDPNEEAQKIDDAREVAKTLNVNTTANINGSNFTIIGNVPETGMPIAQIENGDGSLETREMTNEEVLAMNQQKQNAIADKEENNNLSPIEKMQKAINSGNAELLNVGMEELQTTIENTNDAKSLAELESMVVRFGKEIVAQFKPIFKQKHKELDGEVSSENDSEDVVAEEQSQQSRLQEIRDLVSTIGSEEELDNISIDDDTLTDEEKQIAHNIIEKRRAELRGMAENAQEIAPVGSNGIEGNNVPQEQENSPTSENNGIEEEQTPTIPIKDGEKMYESVSADVTLADLMADFDNDANEVFALVNEHIKGIEKRNPKTMPSRVAKQKSLKYWQGVRDLLNKTQKQTEVKEVETESVSEEPVTTKEPVVESTSEEQTTEGEKVPDFATDKSEDARTRGYRIVNGERVDRQNQIENAVLGNTTETHFSTKDKVEGRVAVVDASMLQPSHTAQGKNPNHFLPEAQPKNRATNESQSNSDLIAQNMNPALITETTTAFNGAPVVNARGEAIQGNNRIIGLQKMYSGYAESAEKYKQYLMDNAERFGLDKNAIANMQNPVLVNMVDVDDAEAIRLGQFDSHDMESGAGEVFKAKQTLAKMGSEKMQSFLNILLEDHGNPDMAISEMVRRNAPSVIEWLAKNNFITQQQAANCYNNGALNTSATDALREMLNQQLFEGGIDNLDAMFDTLPSASQGAIMSIMTRDNMVGADKSLKPFFQLAIEAYHEAMKDEKFAEIGKDLSGAFNYLLSFTNQTELFGNGTTLDPEKFNTFALRLAAMFKTMGKVSLRNALNEYYDLVLGKPSVDLFDDSENAEPKSASEAIEKVFGVKAPVVSETKNNNDNEDRELSGSDVRNDGYEQSEEGGQGSSSDSGSTEQDSRGERRTDSGRGNEGDSREGQKDEVTEPASDREEISFEEDPSKQWTLTDEEKSTLSPEEIETIESRLKHNAVAISKSRDIESLLESTARSAQRAYVNPFNKIYFPRLAAIIKKEIERRADYARKHHITNGKSSISAVSKLFNDLNSDESLSLLFDKVIDVVKMFGADIRFTRQLKRALGNAGVTDNIVKFSYEYFLASGFSNQGKATTLLHELIHNATSYALYAYANRTKISKGKNGKTGVEMWEMFTKEQQDAIISLVAIYKEIGNDWKSFPGGFRGKQYGLTDVYEMTAEMSNPEFREMLKKKNLWEKFVDAIKRLFNKKVEGATETTAFDEVNKALDYLLEHPSKEVYDAVKSSYIGRARKVSDFKIENINNTPSLDILQYLRGKDKYDDEYDRCIETLERRIADFRAREVGTKQSGEREREEKIRRILQIASAICEGVRGVESEVSANIEGAFGEEKVRTLVIEWAKKHNAYIEESEMAESSLNKEPIADTSESTVYISEDGSRAIKLTYPHWMYNTLGEFAESISVFNSYFEESAYQIKGVSLDSRGHLCVVMEQPFVNGEFYGYEDFVNKKPQQDTREMMAERGFVPVESEFDMYTNGIYVVSDVYGKNVCFVDGLPIIIDAHISRSEDVPYLSEDSFEYFIEQEEDKASSGEVNEKTLEPTDAEEVTEEITNPKEIVPYPGETYSHLIGRINEAFEAGERLRKDHLNTAKQIFEERGEKDAKLIGLISDFIFDRMEGAGVQMWFETQESAEEGEGEFQIVGEVGANNYASARKAIEKAKQMEAEGKTPAEIREKTLCERGADGKWRLEIPDTGIVPLPFDSLEGAFKYNGSNPLFKKIAEGMVMADAMGADSDICKLKDLMFGSYARVLFKMYPELANIDVVVSNLGDNTPAALSADAKTLYIWSPEKFRSNIIHEIQHAIQTYEGFSRGGDPGLFEETPESRKADRLYEEIRQTDKRLRAGGASDNGIERSSIAEREGFSSRGDMMKFIAQYSNYYKYLRIKGEVEARNVQKRLDTSRYWRQKHSLESTEDVKRPAQIDSPLDNISEFHLSDGTVYGWANADGVHLTMEGIQPETMIHEYGHLWMAAMKANNPALYESLMRLAKNSPIWNEVVEDSLYDLSSDDAILSEVFARYSGREGERKMLEVTRKAIQNGADYKEKAALAAEYDRLAQKMDKAWRWSAKFLGQDPTSFESMAEAADMLLLDIISGNNPNNGGYTPSGKLKTPKNGNPYFSDKNEYSRGRTASSPSDVASAVSEWINHRVDALQSFATALEESWFDYLASVRDLQLDIVKETGNEVHDYENAYLHAMHLSSVNKEEQDNAKRTHIEPLISAMNTVITPLVKNYENSGMSNKDAREQAMDDLERYMIAKHGEERNKNIARRDAKQQAEEEFKDRIAQATAELKRADEDFAMGLISQSEHDTFENTLNNLKASQLIRENNLYAANRKNDKAGLRQTFEEEAKVLGLWDDTEDVSTATLAELEKIARDYAQDFEGRTGKAETDELWKMINALNALTLKKAFDSGNMSKEIFDQLSSQYKFYVPLKGWHDETADEFYNYTGGDKFSNFQPTVKKAEGRTSRAGDILATMIAMNSSAILHGNKNLVKQKLFSLVQNNPTKLVTVSKTWYEKTPSGGWVEGHPTSLDPVDIAEWEKKMEDMRKTGDARVGVGGLNISKNITLFQEREHEIRVNRGGREYVLYINGAPNPAQALNGQLNIDANPEAWEKVFRWLNRFRAQNYTSRNPEFLIRNLQKDVLDATAMSLTKFGSDYTKQFEKNVLKLLPGSATLSKKNWNLGNINESIDRCYGIFGLISKYKRGELDTGKEIEKHFLEFMENGGHTGYSQLWTIDEAQKDINSAIKRKTDDLRGESMRFVELANKKVELMNAAFEDLTRFATYLTSRQSGKSILISVADAKDASTNFNKKGSGKMGNRFIRDFILFANPQLQGTARIFYRLLDKNMYGSNADLGMKPHQALRATMVFAGIAGLGAMMANLDYLTGLFFGTGDDDKLFGDSALGNSYWKASSYRRHNYILIPGTPIADGYFVGNMTPEFAAAYGTGVIIAEYALGYGHPDQSAKEIASQMSKFVPIIGDQDVTKWHTWSDVGWDLMMKLARSSGGGPVFEVIANEDFMGRKIHGYDGGLRKDSPEWEVWMQQKVIDEWTDGILGSIGNINNIEHTTRGYLGGVVEFPIHVVNMLFEDSELNDTPLKVFWASTASPTSENNAIRTEFFYYKGKVDRLTQELKRKGIKDIKEQQKFVDEHLDNGIDYELWKVYQKYRKDYNSKKVEDKIPIMKAAIQDWRVTEDQD